MKIVGVSRQSVFTYRDMVVEKGVDGLLERKWAGDLQNELETPLSCWLCTVPPTKRLEAVCLLGSQLPNLLFASCRNRLWKAQSHHCNKDCDLVSPFLGDLAEIIYILIY